MSDVSAYDYWLDHITGLSVNTRKTYVYQFNLFLRWVDGENDYKTTANKLYALAAGKKEQEGDPRLNHKVEDLVNKYMQHMMKEEKAYGTIKPAFAAIKSFFKKNLVSLNWSVVDIPRGESIGSKIPEKHEIRDIIQRTNARCRTALLLLKDSGLRLSDIYGLKWSQLESRGDGFMAIRPFLTKKRKVRAVTFIGPETTESLKAVPHEGERIFNWSKASSCTVILNRIIKRAGYNDITAHGLRRYFNVEMQGARIPQEHIYMMMGKTVRDKNAYTETRQSRLLEEYKQAYDCLRVYEGAEEASKAELESLKQVVTRQAAKLDALNDMLQYITGYSTDSKETVELLDSLKRSIQSKKDAGSK